jgi:flagellum-specific ATP synthase
MLPSFLERAGTTPDRGTITGLITVLVEGDDMNEPIADAVRGILDGHIVLSRQLAHRNHYPSVDILQSVSRAMVDIVPPDHFQSARRVMELVSVYRDAEDLINIGAYQKGSNPEIDLAIQMTPTINAFLKQRIQEAFPYQESLDQMMDIAKQCEPRRPGPANQSPANQPPAAPTQQRTSPQPKKPPLSTTSKPPATARGGPS